MINHYICNRCHARIKNTMDATTFIEFHADMIISPEHFLLCYECYKDLFCKFMEPDLYKFVRIEDTGNVDSTVKDDPLRNEKLRINYTPNKEN